MVWDPALYLRFADQRLRPALDLLARIDLDAPQSVVDLGCGAGNVTVHLKRRWPGAHITGVDNSATMLAKARDTDPAVSWQHGELASWVPAEPVTLLYSNAALHWADGHAELFPRLARAVAPNGVLAVQMPRQNGAPSHQAAFKLAKSARWRSALQHLLRESPVAEPQQYHDWLAPHVSALDIWETEYQQIMQGNNPIADWTSGTFLLPFLEALQGADRAAFDAEYRAAIVDAYPRRADGSTLFPFRRLFIVATF
jgi:trans-aconitate 2-methyltransferase